MDIDTVDQECDVVYNVDDDDYTHKYIVNFNAFIWDTNECFTAVLKTGTDMGNEELVFPEDDVLIVNN